MTIASVLSTIGELGFVDIRSDRSIHVTPPAMNVHQARMEPFVSFLQDYVRAHPGFRFKGFFTLYDAWREHAEPCSQPRFVELSGRSLQKFVGTGTLGEPGRFLQPYQLKDYFPVFPYPVLSFGRHGNDPFVQLIPDTDFIRSRGYIQLQEEIDRYDCEWQQKQKRLFWRGSMHGFPYSAYDPERKKSQRALLVDWSTQHGDICDACSSHTATKQEQLRYRYLIDIDGEVNAWSGLYWKLYSNSVVFKVSSHYEQWYYNKLVPWTHYIPVQGDLNDLQEKFSWALQHDDECSLIAAAGREFAVALTYQQVVEDLRFSGGVKELFIRHSVEKNPAAVAASVRRPIVIHSYQVQCHTVSQAPGLGDFLRGTITLFQLSRIHGFDVHVDFTGHPLSRYIKRHDVIPDRGSRVVHEFFNQDNARLEPFLTEVSADETFVYTHCVPEEPVDDACRAFILKRLQPVSELSDYIARVRAELGLDRYCTIHLRMGDSLMGQEASVPPVIEEWFQDRILPQWGARVLVLSDNVSIKEELRQRFGVRTIEAKPVHLGQTNPDLNDTSDLHDTLAEFLLMSQSERIYQYSAYSWGSGFSEMCSRLYAVPLERITLQSLDTTRSEEMSPDTSKQKSAAAGIVKAADNKVKLDIACGKNKKPGFTGVDIWDGADIVCDLEQFPWPFEDNSVDEIFCSHYVEHTPDLISFANEIYRIMKVGATAEILAPYYSSIRAWQDPTHLRAISEATFLYFSKQWRTINRLDHYPITVDFDYECRYIIDPNWRDKTGEELEFAIRHYINVVSDIHAILTKRAPVRDDTHELLMQATTHWDNDECDQASALCRRVLEIEDNVEALLMVAEYELKMGNFDEAIAQFTRAAGIDAELFEAHAGLVRAYVAAGRSKEAINHIKALGESDPDFASQMEMFL